MTEIPRARVRALTEQDWPLMRDVRLAALQDAPHAFGSTYAREVAFTEQQWRARFSDRAVTYFGYLPSCPEPAGLAGVYIEEDGSAELVSMWVRPAARGQQVGQALVKAAAAWTRAHDYRRLSLWVTESNGPARRLYERCGFTATGEAQPLPSHPDLAEIRMSRRL